MQMSTFGRRPQGKPAVDIAQEVDARLAAYEPVHLPSFVEAQQLSANGAAQRNAQESNNGAAQAQQRPVRIKTSHVLIFMCLQIGNDPPDYVRIEPCAKLECWMDPSVAQARFMSRGSEAVAEALESKYKIIQKDAMYKRFVEVTIDDAKTQLASIRRKARDGRVLFHYNGHGMPRATHLGEMWFFDKDRSHYMPMHISDVANTLDSPAIYVFDCNSAGSLLTHWQPRGDPQTDKRSRDFMICACSEGEFLPMNPLLPADMLTACLTTPITMVQEWFISYSYRRVLLPNVTDDMVRHIPGDPTDRKTPLGELHWIFTAVTDTIAWCTTPEQLFHSLFRQDVVVKALFRNYLLAEKLLREVGCTPVTYPALPDTTYAHYMWDAWEVAFESIVSQLPSILNSDMTVNTMYTYKPTTFFADQLTAFEVWVEAGDPSELPEQLPCVILALTQISQRVRALVLLSRYLATGATAVAYAVRCGVLLYLSKLLMHTPEVFLLVTVVWSQLVAVDSASTCAELIKNLAEKHFIRLLSIDESKIRFVNEGDAQNGAVGSCGPTSPAGNTAPLSAVTSGSQQPAQTSTFAATSSDTGGSVVAGNAPAVPDDTIVFYAIEGVDLHRCIAAACFIISKILDHGGEKMYLSCWNQLIVKSAMSLIARPSATLKSWGCLLLSKMFSGLRAAKEVACQEYAKRVNLFSHMLSDSSPLVRSSCASLMATLLGTRLDTLDEESQFRRVESEKATLIQLRQKLFDHSSVVRQELIFAAAQVLTHYGPLFEGSLSSDRLIGCCWSASPSTASQRQWKLHEPGVSVKSALNASKPTDNILFAETATIATTFLAKDDAPHTTPWDRSRVNPRMLEIIEFMVHDAGLMMGTMHRNADQRLVENVVDRLLHHNKIGSFRLAAETSRSSMAGVSTEPSMQHVHTDSLGNVGLSEEGRAKKSRNRDQARRMMLDIQAKRFEASNAGTASPTGNNGSMVPNGSLPSSSSNSSSPASPMAQGSPVTTGGSPADAAVSRPTFGQMHWTVQTHDPIVCGQFRLLEPHAVFAERNNRITIVDYETNPEGPSILTQMSHPGPSPIHAMVVVNDLSTDPGLVVLNNVGGFTVYRGMGDQRIAPQEACTFAAAGSTAGGGGALDLKLAYRSDGHLLYAGPSGNTESVYRNEITLVNLTAEQVVHTLGITGDTAITSFAAHPTTRSIFVGLADGIIKYYDDRSKQGLVSAISNLQKKGVPVAADSIVGVSVIDESAAGSNTGMAVMACTTNSIRLFDVRQPNQPTKIIDIVQLTANANTSSAVAAAGSAVSKTLASFSNSSPVTAQPSNRVVTGFSASLYTGMCCATFSDNICDLYNVKCNSVIPRPLKIKDAGLGASFMHPLRPMAFLNGEFVMLY